MKPENIATIAAEVLKALIQSALHPTGYSSAESTACVDEALRDLDQKLSVASRPRRLGGVLINDR